MSFIKVGVGAGVAVMSGGEISAALPIGAQKGACSAQAENQPHVILLNLTKSCALTFPPNKALHMGLGAEVNGACDIQLHQRKIPESSTEPEVGL